MGFARRTVRRFLRRFGYDIRKQGALGRTMADALAHLRRLGFEPSTVIDVGVAEGTPDLYAAYPSAQYFLVEPIAEYAPQLERLAERLHATVVSAAAGPAPGETGIFVHGTGSSVFHEPNSPFANAPRRVVPVVTLDAACASALEPVLIKVDLQGGELDVLAGAEVTLRKTEVVILETSLWEGIEGWPTLLEVLTWMNRAGFSAYDICGGGPRPSDGALAQVDVVFVKTAGRFRANRNYFAHQL